MDLTNENDKRLADCHEAHDGRGLGNLAKLSRVKPMLMIPSRLKRKNTEMQAYNDLTIRALSNIRFGPPLDL